MEQFDGLNPAAKEEQPMENSFPEYLSSLSEKCDYGSRMEALDSTERTIYLVTQFDYEIRNGGFAQYFYSSDSSITEEIVPALSEVGAYETAKICEKALLALEENMLREELADRDQPGADRIFDERVFSVLEPFDDLLEACDENPEHLCFIYLQEQGRDFT